MKKFISTHSPKPMLTKTSSEAVVGRYDTDFRRPKFLITPLVIENTDLGLDHESL
jgi:hypothetical protein